MPGDALQSQLLTRHEKVDIHTSTRRTLSANKDQMAMNWVPLESPQSPLS